MISIREELEEFCKVKGLEPLPDFDPTKQYGNYLMLNEPYAPEPLIKEAKDILQHQINLSIPEAYREPIEWIVNPRYRVQDPVSGKVRVVTCVAWKTRAVVKEVAA